MVAMWLRARSRATLPGQKGHGFVAAERGELEFVERRREMKHLSVRWGDADAGKQVSLLEAKIHEGHGERCGPSARGELDDTAERGAVVASVFRIGLLVQEEIGANGHAQAA